MKNSRQSNHVECTLLPARRSPRAWAILLIVLGLSLSLDLWSKQAAFQSVAGSPVTLERSQLIAERGADPIPPHQGISVLPWDLLDFRLVLNSGAVFGLGAHQRWFFVLFSIAAIGVAVWIFGWRTDRRATWLHIGISLILAGAIGNLWDRLTIGRVRDFLYMLPGWKLPFGLTWPGGNPEVWPWIFNVADVSLLAGMGIVLVYLTWEDRQRQRAIKAARQGD